MKNIFLFSAILAAMQKALNFAGLNAPPSARTPRIPHHGGRGRTRAHAPNDGRWHMKFHRSRV